MANVKDHPLYQLRKGMIARCHRPTHRDYMIYGGRGIYVCSRWRFGENGQSGFECFLADMGPRPPGKSLDRIDNDGHYEPANCRWATPSQQSRNRRPNWKLEIGGEVLCIAEAAERYGLNMETLRARLRRGRWSLEEAIRLPLLSPHEKGLLGRR